MWDKIHLKDNLWWTFVILMIKSNKYLILWNRFLQFQRKWNFIKISPFCSCYSKKLKKNLKENPAWKSTWEEMAKEINGWVNLVLGQTVNHHNHIIITALLVVLTVLATKNTTKISVLNIINSSWSFCIFRVLLEVPPIVLIVTVP